MCTCVETINETRLVKARKNYVDSNKFFIEECLYELRQGAIKPSPTFSEWRLIAESRRDNWKIKKGTMYEHSVLKMEDQIYQWRTKPGLDELCQKCELWPEC